jgi:predicted esterase
MMLKKFPILLLLLSLNVFAQEITLKKGAVVDSIKVNDSISETFALFLPTAFTKEKVWPVVFVFDPEGRGRAAAQLFRQGAEDQGYIIVASNNIVKKDSLLNNLKVASRMMTTIFNYLPIDQNGVYTAGFAEGAEVASAVPAIFKNAQGVIGAGGIWMNPDFLKKENKFSFLGISGTRDSRLYNMEEMVRFLKMNGYSPALYKFDGGHEWPGSSIISSALGNFTLQAIAKGYRPKDPKMVEGLFQFDIAVAESLRRQLEFYEAYQYLELMKSTYALFDKKDEIRDLQRDIKRNKIFRQQRKNYNAAEYLEEETKAEYLFYFDDDVATANFNNLPWWGQQVVLLKKYQDGKNEAEAEMAYRLQGMLESMTDKTFKNLKENNVPVDFLVFTAILQTIFDKQDPDGYMNIISITAQDRDYETALLYLEDLLKTGYKDMEALYNIPGTLDLKLSPEYNTMIQKYLGESKFYDQ